MLVEAGYGDTREIVDLKVDLAQIKERCRGHIEDYWRINWGSLDEADNGCSSTTSSVYKTDRKQQAEPLPAPPKDATPGASLIPGTEVPVMVVESNNKREDFVQIHDIVYGSTDM